jgi:hypothetical protein
MPQPASTPDWNNAGVSPTTPKKTTGWLTNEAPPASNFNWFWTLVSSWITYLKNLAGEVFVWTAAHTFAAAVTTQVGVTGTQSTANAAAFTGTGNGTGAGFDGTGGTTGGTGGPGVKGTGGGVNANGVVGQGTGNGAGVVGTGGTGPLSGDGVSGQAGNASGYGGSFFGGPVGSKGLYASGDAGAADFYHGTNATATTRKNVAKIGNGDLDFDSVVYPNANVAHKNKLGPSNICKAWATARITPGNGGGGLFTIGNQDGFNVALSRSASTNMDVTFQAGFANTTYCPNVLVSSSAYPGATAKLTIVSATVLRIAIIDAAGALLDLDAAATANTIDVYVQVFGRQ